MTEAGLPGQGSPVASNATFAARLANASRAAGPPLLFGLRLLSFRFARDSPLEGDGFELPVPGALGEAEKGAPGEDHGSSVPVRLSRVRLSGNFLCWHQPEKPKPPA